MNQTIRQQRRLRDANRTRRRRAARLQHNVIAHATHPHIAGVLANLAHAASKAADRLVVWLEEGVGAVLMLVGVVALLWARAQGWFA